MTRGISTLNENASKDEVVRIVNLLILSFDSGDVHFCTGDMNVLWNGDTYYAISGVGSITPLQESTQLQASSVVIKLSGLPTDGWINQVLNEQVQGRVAQLYIAYFDNNWGMIDTPTLMFEGSMDTVDLDIGETASVSLTVQNKLTDWDRPDNTNFSQHDQLSRYPGDNFFNFVEKMVDQAIHWGDDSSNQQQK